MRIAKEILESSAKMKMDLGINKRHLGLMETEARVIADVSERYQDTRVAEAMKDSQSRQRLSGAMVAFQRFMLTEGQQDETAAAQILDEMAEIVDESPILPIGANIIAEAPQEEDVL